MSTDTVALYVASADLSCLPLFSHAFGWRRSCLAPFHLALRCAFRRESSAAGIEFDSTRRDFRPRHDIAALVIHAATPGVCFGRRLGGQWVASMWPDPSPFRRVCLASSPVGMVIRCVGLNCEERGMWQGQRRTNDGHPVSRRLECRLGKCVMKACLWGGYFVYLAPRVLAEWPPC